MVYGRVVRVLSGEKTTKIIVRNGKNILVEMPTEVYEKQIMEKNGGTILTQEVEIENNNIKVFK
jgi:polysaccharide deacetylase 2 family uncharacterized protein YibQ